MKGCSESTDTNRRHKNCERLTLRHDDTEQQRDRNPSVILLLSERVSVCVCCEDRQNVLAASNICLRVQTWF